MLLKIAVVLLIAVYAHRRKSLTKSGIIGALCVGLIHAHCSLNLMLLVTFFLTSTKLTKFKNDIKSQLIYEESPKSAHVARNLTQVLSNSVVATLLAVLNSFDYSCIYQIGIICHYCCVTADTWSSELGILSESDPFLITTFLRVPKGTNGGVSLTGINAAFAGSCLISLISVLTLMRDESFAAIMMNDYSVEPNGFFFGFLFLFFSASGIFGSLLDSLLGATLQSSYVVDQKCVEIQGGGKLVNAKKEKLSCIGGANVLSNNGVNLVMAGLTTTFFMALFSKTLTRIFQSR